MKIGVLCIHGFSGGTYEIAPLQQYLAAHLEAYFVMPTLPGHGEVLTLQHTKASHWLKAAENAYRVLARKVEQVIVVGFSMGGVIALHLAARYPIAKLVLLSPAMRYLAPKALLLQVNEMGKSYYYQQLQENEIYQRYAFKWGKVRLPDTIQFMKLVQQTTPYLARVTAPTIIIQGMKDGMVPYQTAQYIKQAIHSQEKEIYYSTGGLHHICFSKDRERWFQDVLQFIQPS